MSGKPSIYKGLRKWGYFLFEKDMLYFDMRNEEIRTGEKMGQFTIYREDVPGVTLLSNSFIDNYMKDANDAQLKIYLTASVETRAKRRYLENLERGLDADLETIKKEIEERDYQDTHREISPLKKAEDAIELDTSSLTLEEVVEQVLTLIQKAKEE